VNRSRFPVSFTSHVVSYILLQSTGIGIVERVVLLGTPQTLDKDRWESVRKVRIAHAIIIPRFVVRGQGYH